jgi:hypothetical protein
MTDNCYSKQEKEIFEDHFIKQSDGHRLRFESYVAEVISKHDPEKKLVVINEKIKNPGKRLQARNELRTQQKTVPFDNHNILWDRETGDNLVTHFLSQDSFIPSGNTLFDLNRVHPNWHHKNKDGNNPLMLLSKKGEYDLVKKVLKDFKLDPNASNKDGLSFTNFLFEPNLFKKNPEEIEIHYLRRINRHLDNMVSVFNDYPDHFKTKKCLEKVIINMEQIDSLINQNVPTNIFYLSEKIAEANNFLVVSLHEKYLNRTLHVKKSKPTKKVKI